jgi:hypothetical protein
MAKYNQNIKHIEQKKNIEIYKGKTHPNNSRFLNKNLKSKKSME